MITTTLKILGDGQLPSSAGDLYLVPVSTQAAVKSISCNNTTTVSVQVDLWIKKSGGTARKIRSLKLKPGYTVVVDDVPTLAAGDAVRGQAGTASVIDYVINGIERV